MIRPVVTFLLNAIILMLSTVNADAQTASLRARIDDLIRASGAEAVAVAYHDLGTGEQLLIRADERFHPASTIKVPIMMEVFRQARARRLSLDDSITVKNSFISIADGSVFSVAEEDDSESTLYRRIGQTATIRELVTLMIQISSNFATNLLVEKVTPASCTDLMKKMGAPDIRVLRGVEDGKAFERGMNSVVTAKGLMRILTLLAERRAVSTKASDEMIRILLGQKFNDAIPAGLPPEVKVAHKTGWTGAVDHDAAIIFAPDRKPLVLLILTRGCKDQTTSQKLMADIARLVCEHAAESPGLSAWVP